MTDRSNSTVEWNLDRAQKMRDDGSTWAELGRHFGISPDTVRKRLSRDYWAKRRAMQRENAKSPSAPRNYVFAAERIEDIPPVPADTRGLTARICGDPLPGRSALDMRLGGVSQ